MKIKRKWYIRIVVLIVLPISLWGVINHIAIESEDEPPKAVCNVLEGTETTSGTTYTGTLAPAKKLNYSYISPFGGLSQRVLFEPEGQQEYLSLNGQMEPTEVQYNEGILGYVRFHVVLGSDDNLSKCG